MKILVYRYGSICEPDIIEQFTRAGLTVDTICNEIDDKGVTPDKRIDIIRPYLDGEKYLFVFSINFFPIISDICRIYNVPYVCWSVDAPVLELFAKSITNPCNRIFAFDRQQYDEIRKHAPQNIFHLPLATNVDRWDKVLANTDRNTATAKYGGDISFVGNLYIEKDPVLLQGGVSSELNSVFDKIIEHQLMERSRDIISGYMDDNTVKLIKSEFSHMFPEDGLCVENVDRFVAQHAITDMHYAVSDRIDTLTRLAECFEVNLFTNSNTSGRFVDSPISIRKPVASLTEMPLVFRYSKINLNITLKSIAKGLPLRIWDIMGCGGFLMTNYQEELEDYLVIGEDCEAYSSIDELIDKCRFYLENDSIREKVARNGYEKVKKYHTYINRMPRIIEHLF